MNYDKTVVLMRLLCTVTTKNSTCKYVIFVKKIKELCNNRARPPLYTRFFIGYWINTGCDFYHGPFLFYQLGEIKEVWKV